MNPEDYAFPNPIQHGMTLLEWYAGQALAIVLSAAPPNGSELWSPRDVNDYAAKMSFDIGEAMIRESEKRKAKPA
jgi:hypothetical protein